MRYELLLQTMTPGMPYEAARVDGLLSERRLTVRPDGVRLWNLKHGDVEVGVLREGGQVVATELRVPLGEQPDLMREVVSEASALARAAQVRLMDPQLGRAVSGTDDTMVVEQYLRTARYASEVSGGLSGGLSGGSYESLSTERPGFQPGVRFFAIVIGVFIALYLIVDSMLSSLGSG
ncbi:hypothetical protein LZ198_08645 [Myxococcus sp. K15C18031901]|uniref:hypothetical protein n=1 Tax=Myxococcus dinghuensis TaxID=2906761 RepID=UPI0020A7BF3E|nr:hypothetical protein [Myxococcus dinghuensis]MCP3098943.1 hypothetical protein [Myxococcus dinghuensis]